MDDQYFEGILQLRDPNDEVIRFIESYWSLRDNVWIAKKAKVRGGIDFYVSSQRYLLSMATKLRAEFGGDLKISKKIHTRDKQTSKDLYRGYLYFRPTKYKKGEVITYRGERIQVISAKKEIFGQNLSTNKKVHIKFSQL